MAFLGSTATNRAARPEIPCCDGQLPTYRTFMLNTSKDPTCAGRSYVDVSAGMTLEADKQMFESAGLSSCLTLVLMQAALVSHAQLFDCRLW